eukprot:gnl/Spiro4/2018_TR971_c0_g1_i1.p2 gnl/Spiro4/2018_TR971_c0_g1~~gnl/Spiro4/2018_TR971_c0_g1_i1.p2  ORF type:complete len:247 (+),score=49.62 gnl/Spiro4/2018_TR971_c0_g1_i1:38-742(+)
MVKLLLLVLVIAAALQVQAFSDDDNTTSLDTHILLTPNAFNMALWCNKFLKEFIGENLVDFDNLAKPHATLYLTIFANSNISTLTSRLAALSLHAVPLTLSKVVYSGTYIMWHVDMTPGLQLMSDTVVNKTHDLIIPNVPVPDWVNNLPEPERTKRINMVHEYGSPGVFDEFEAHVTLGVVTDPIKMAKIPNAVAALNNLNPTLTFTPTNFALGRAGPFGTVLKQAPIYEGTLL